MVDQILNDRLHEITVADQRLKAYYDRKAWEWESYMTEISRALKKLTSIYAEIDKDIQDIKHHFVNLVHALQLCATEEDIEKVNRLLERWPVGEFISPTELQLMIKEHSSKL